MCQKYNADIVIRLTADCPLIDPVIIDKAISTFMADASLDYLANTVPVEASQYPDGSDVEIFSMKALERAHHEAKDLKDREHVTFYFWKGNHGFKTYQLKNDQDWSKYRITVDYPEDFEVINRVIKLLKSENKFGTLEEIINLLKSHKEIVSLNKNYYFGIGWKDK